MILDLVHNSVEAESGEIEISLEETDAVITVLIRDDGHGMDEVTRRAALDPFYTDGKKHPRRRVGLGLPFLIQTIDQVGGQYRLDTEPGRGTELEFTIDLSHVDAPPFGDVPGLFLDLICFSGTHEMILHRRRNGVEYTIRRSDLREVLGELSDIANRRLALEYLVSQEEQ